QVKQIAETYVVDQKRLHEFLTRGVRYIDDEMKRRGWSGWGRHVEQKFAYDPFANSARLLLSKKERDYSGKKPSELPGTADLVLVSPDQKQFVVLDWKTGVKDYDVE